MLQHGTWIILQEKNPSALPGFEPRTVQPEVYSLYRLRYSGFPLRERSRMFSCPLGINVLCLWRYSVLYFLHLGCPYKCLHEPDHNSKTLAILTVTDFEN